MLGSNPKTVQEIEDALSQPNCTIDELLKCSGIASQIRNDNHCLIDFLLDEKNTKRIFEIIHTNSTRATQKSILGLFQTSNPVLHRTFADNLLITEYAVNMLDSPTTANSNYGVGIISRIISRAFDLWPDDMSEVFRISKTIYKTLIRHIHNTCVYHSIQDMITETHKGLWLFMWYCFRALTPKGSKDYHLTKRAALIDDDFEIDPNELTDLHRENILNILRLFFKLKLNAEGEFAENVITYIKNQNEMSTLSYTLALSLFPNEVLMNRAVHDLLTCTDFLDPKIEKALNYVAFSLKDTKISIDNLTTIFYLVLTHSESSNFVLNALNDLFEKALEHLEGISKRTFVENVKKIIMVEFNKQKETYNPMHYSFLISLASKCGNQINEEEQWKNFILNVVQPWEEDLEYDEKFVFDISNIDISAFQNIGGIEV